MKSAPLVLLALAASASAFSVEGQAHALGPIDLEIGGRIGGATSPLTVGPNPLGLGFGARAGIDLFGFYGGASFMYYLGGSQDIPGGTQSATSTLYGVEVGYNIGIPLISLRPQVGIGNYELDGSGSGQFLGVSFSGSQSFNALYIEPGIVGTLSLGLWYVGADINLLWLPSADTSQYKIYTPNGLSGVDTQLATTIHGQLGVKF
jgi:hypothetical protein